MPPPTKGSINAKRAGSRVSNIKAKAARGEASGEERAFMRMGKSNTRILTGQEDLSEWDDEELRRGRKKDRNGGWRGIDPVIIPKALHDELVRRTLSKANTLLRDNLHAAVQALTSIVEDEDVEPKDRLRAAGMIMDRVMGKDPIPVKLDSETPPWQVAIQAGIVSITNSMTSDALLGSDAMHDGEPRDPDDDE